MKLIRKRNRPVALFIDEAHDLHHKTLVGLKRSTPLQINHYAWISLVKAHQIGQKPAHIDVLEAIVSNDLDSIEARLKRSGYDLKTISETVNAKPSEIKALFTGRLVSDRAKEIQDEILKLGITAG